MNTKEALNILVDLDVPDNEVDRVGAVIDFIMEQESKLLEANKTIVSIDNLSLEESGYSYACDTHDHDDCGDCVVNMAKDYIKKHS